MNEHIDWIKAWFKTKGWEPREFQLDAWSEYLKGQNGLIYVSTGFGKTYAGCLAALAELALEKVDPRGIQILYISPLRALSGDVIKSLRLPIEELQLPYTVESRTGDTSSYERARQKKNPPTILVTTPESFNLLLVSEDYRQAMKKCRLVVIDEWHELMGNKRGIQVQLCLSHLRSLAPNFRVWGLSATIGNPDLAGRVLNGNLEKFSFVTEKVSKEIDIQCLLPDEIDSFPWAGHMGTAMMQKVVDHIDLKNSCLIFTNTRNQAERWFNEISLLKPEWAPLMALHHSSVDREMRERIEDEIKTGELKLVVCTSSLDLGVDFPKVERVYQIGSPKSISRFIQRAGRSGHTPTGVPRIYFVPTHALELFEYLAVELAIDKGLKEEVIPPEMSYDVLAQHMVSIAANEGLDKEEAMKEITSTYAYRNLKDQEFDQLLEFLTTGGRSLSAYPYYHKLKEHKGRFLIHDKKMIQQHLMNMGTITSDPSIKIRFMKGGSLGSVEESFVGRLKKGDTFIFAGKSLEYVIFKDLTLFVRLAPPGKAVTAIWGGARLPLSSLLTDHLKQTFEMIEKGEFHHPLVEYLSPITEVQRALSRLPGRNFLLMEETVTREGKHLFMFPFEGKLVHEALASLIAVRMSAFTKVTFSFAVSEYGFEVLAPADYKFDVDQMKEILSTENLSVDIQKSLNMTQLAKKQFREIAQVSGLIQQNRPGDRRTMKNLQMSSSLLFDVFGAYEPEQPLYHQSFDEVRFFQFQEERLRSVLEKLAQMPFEYYKTSRPSPLAFPLIIERIGSRVTSETLTDRLQKMKAKWTGASNSRF
jgi:ATP-dependent helicase Lhr and Lhr-like helicase